MRVDQRFALLSGAFAAVLLLHSPRALADVGNAAGGDSSVIATENNNLLDGDEPEYEETSGQEAGVAGALPGTSVSGSNVMDSTGLAGHVNANYLAIFYGPALSGGGSYQPTTSGTADLNRPVQLRNFANVGYNISDTVAVTGTFYWLWEAPQQLGISMQDPQLRLSKDRILGDGNDFDFYADVRFHVPLSQSSRVNDIHGGLQFFQGVSYMVPSTSLQANLYTSERYNFMGKLGSGNDLELYLAPNLVWGFSRKFSLSFTAEAGASHVFGSKFGTLQGNGVDLEPGFFWEAVPNLLLNPYLTFYPGAALSMKTTSFGMTLSWTLI